MLGSASAGGGWETLGAKAVAIVETGGARVFSAEEESPGRLQKTAIPAQGDWC